MKEKKSMNQEVINVELFSNNGVDTLLFKELGSKEGISVNLNSTTGQQDLKNVFGNLLHILQNKDVELRLNINPLYKKGLYKEVCEEYIKDLNKEIKAVRADILNINT
jgi:hypothetical protein